jgi:hypothetical protein
VNTLRDMLESGHNKALALEITAWVGGDRRRFSELVGFMTGANRASRLFNRWWQLGFNRSQWNPRKRIP